MATTDTRSGFRLPWSSDRPHEDTAGTDAAEAATEPTTDAASPADAPAWPHSDFSTRLGITPAEPRPPDPEAAAGQPRHAAGDRSAVPATPPPAAPRKPTKLMVDLAVAIRATTESARDQRLAQVDAEATAIVELIRAQSTEGAAALRRRSDEDVAAIREWAKAEIARIREESDTRIASRKHMLEGEITSHAAAIEDRVGEVDSTVTGYREAMRIYFDRLTAEDDPARLATMAETMPDAPSLDLLADFEDLPLTIAGPEAPAPATAMVAEPVPTVVAGPEAVAEPVEAVVAEPVEALAEPVEAAVAEPVAALEQAGAPVATAEADEADGSDGTAEADLDIDAARVARATGWSDEPEVSITPGGGAASPGRYGPNWTAGETRESFPEPEAGGDPVDRGAIMAALEAAAEAVVAAESAAESADQAQAAAGVAETAAELLVGRHDEDDPEAQAALSARVDAGGFDTESFADRLASLLPGHAEGSADGEPKTTQVVVTGLVSVASIASFKRHLARLAGVTAVAVASGPDGEFVFNVTHRPDVSFRDVIPSMPGFAARVTATGDGAVTVTARDPESEG